MKSAVLLAACLPVCLLLLGGCFASPSPDRMVELAFDPGSTPDERREGIIMLSARSWGQQEPYLMGYATVLRLDRDPRVRSAAIRSLARGGNAAYAEVVAQALQDTVVDVRRDAAGALDTLVAPEALGPLRRHAQEDADADVRSLCARALRHYPGPATQQTLLHCLGDEQFGVRYQAHESLVKLTGEDHGFEPRRWLAQSNASQMR